MPMNLAKETMTRYLLGELSEPEQAQIEEAYFADPGLLDAITRAESELLDDYVRGRLASHVRSRVEQVYLAEPLRRERVKFAQTLASTLDRPSVGSVAVSGDPRPASRWLSKWRSWINALGGQTLRSRLVVPALLIVAIVSAGVWFGIQSRRSRPDVSQAGATPTNEERRVPQPEEPAPIAPRRDEPTFVTLALAVGPGVRAADAGIPVTLSIPPGTAEVRLQLSLREHDYPSYRAIIRAVGGAEILRRGDLTPQASPPAFNLVVPASAFDPGDYMLTLQGAMRGGEFEDLSQSLFRVEKK